MQYLNTHLTWFSRIANRRDSGDSSFPVGAVQADETAAFGRPRLTRHGDSPPGIWLRVVARSCVVEPREGLVEGISDVYGHKLEEAGRWTRSLAGLRLLISSALR